MVLGFTVPPSILEASEKPHTWNTDKLNGADPYQVLVLWNCHKCDRRGRVAVAGQLYGYPRVTIWATVGSPDGLPTGRFVASPERR